MMNILELYVCTPELATYLDAMIARRQEPYRLCYMGQSRWNVHILPGGTIKDARNLMSRAFDKVYP